MRSSAGKPKGLLNAGSGPKKFTHNRYLPTGELRFFIEHFWFVSWDLRGKDPHIQEVLPHPSVHVIFEKGRSRIVGVVTGKFSRLLKNKGEIFGIKFRPGAFYPFWKSSVSELTDRVLPVDEVFNISCDKIEKTVFSLKNREKMMDYAERFVKNKKPKRDPKIELINRVVDWIKNTNDVLKVEDIAAQYSISKRTLQRLLKRYVGVPPKWVIMRYRLHEAIERLDENQKIKWTKLALDLGYFDQAHFIKDFKAMVGRSPTEYA